AELLRRRQVQVGVDDLPLAHERVLVGQGLLDLDDHLGALPDLGLRPDDLRPGLLELLVREPGSVPGAGLHEHGVPPAGEDAHAGRYHADPVLAGLDFRRDTDDHARHYGAPAARRQAAGGCLPWCPVTRSSSVIRCISSCWPRRIASMPSSFFRFTWKSFCARSLSFAAWRFWLIMMTGACSAAIVERHRLSRM